MLLSQVTVLSSVVFSGLYVTDNVLFSPLFNTIFCSVIEIEFNSTGNTVTLQVAFCPFDACAVTVVSPTPIASIVPSVEIFAIFSSSELQAIVLSAVVSTGLYATINFSVCPNWIDVSVFIDIEVSGTSTFTLQIASKPFTVVALISVSPPPIAVTFPFSTVATDVSVDDHVIVLSISVSVGL